MESKRRDPWHTWVFIVGVLGLFGVIGVLNPRTEWALTESVVLRLPMWHPWQDYAITQAEAALAKRDSTREYVQNDSLMRVKASEPKKPNAGQGRIRFAPSDSMGFAKMAMVLENVKLGGSARILHYGDSQIEGDRITGDLREALQRAYGGMGPGMQPLVPFVPMAAWAQTTEGNWKRMVSFGRREDKNPDNRYGLRGVAHRFERGTTKSPDATSRFSPRSYGPELTRKSTHFTLLHGPTQSPLEVKWFANDTLWKIEYVESDARAGVLTAEASAPVKSLRLEFTGESPDFYGLAMDGPTGISVDNIAMRGADGLSFSRMERDHFIQALKRQRVALVILQFGGNSVPYFKSKEAVTRYGEAFRRQIRLFQEALPAADILVVGPSDMAFKEGMDWVSYPFVADVRDALREAAFTEGAGFFDIMDFMGGPGAMVQWVDAEPPLAGPDHIHFTPRGAKKVAMALVEALNAELQRHE